MRFLFVIAVFVSLTACGQKGALYQPEAQPQQPPQSKPGDARQPVEQSSGKQSQSTHLQQERSL